MIEAIGGFLQRNLIVLLAVVLVPMKLAILRICGDSESQRAALISIPEDLVYVSLGLVLGDFATEQGAFRRWYRYSSHIQMNLAVVVGLGISVAIIVHLLAKFTNDQLKTWRAASNVALRKKEAHPAQQDLGLSHALDANVRRIQIRHVAGCSILYLLQLGVTVWWLSWIAGVLANGQ
jgi:hypothetical protein